MDELPANQHANNAAAPQQEPHPHHIVLTDSPVNEEEERERRKTERKRKIRKAPPWIEAACAILLVVITGAYTYYASTQADVMKGQLNQMAIATRRSRIDNLAAISAQKEIAQNALTKSQDNFIKSQTSAADQMRLDERAWVTEVGISGEPQVDQPFAILVELKNTGKTPARNFKGKIVSDPTPLGREPDLSKLEKVKYSGSGIVAPNASKFLTSYPIDGSATTKFPKEGMDELKRETLYVFGQVEYDDVFDCHHWTTFCVFLDPRENYRKYSMCKKHNDTDENRCPVTVVTKVATP